MRNPEAAGSGQLRALRGRRTAPNWVRFVAMDENVTRILEDARQGDGAAAERLLGMLYDELKKIARARMRGQAPAHTFGATDLVHEAWMKVAGRDAPWESRGHFFCVAAKAMRQVLVDHARAKKAAKRGGDRDREPLSTAIAWFEEQRLDLVALDEALGRLEKLDPTQFALVDLRFFGGLTTEQAAEALGVSRATAERKWAMARAWLHRELGAAPE